MAGERDTVHAKGRLAMGACGPVLRLDGGGEWEIGHSGASARLMGQRVEVTGRRAGFNELICDAIWREGTARPHRQRLSIELYLAAAFVLYGLFANLKGIFD